MQSQPPHLVEPMHMSAGCLTGPNYAPWVKQSKWRWRADPPITKIAVCGDARVNVLRSGQQTSVCHTRHDMIYRRTAVNLPPTLHSVFVSISPVRQPGVLTIFNLPPLPVLFVFSQM